MQTRLLIEPYELAEHGLSGTENYCFVDAADYPAEIFEGVDAGLDIHAGAFESATMKLFYQDLLDEKIAANLPDCSLDNDTIQIWLQGGDAVRSIVPLGHAGNPAEYGRKLKDVNMIYEILSEYIAEKICS